MTHSYTVQPMISRDGKTFGKLLLVLQEPTTGTFGPRIAIRVRDFERLYGNIRVFASKSGKLSSQLIQRWLVEVLQPAIRGTLRSVDTDTDIGSEYETLSADNEVFGEPSVNSTSAPDSRSTDRRGPERVYRHPHSLLIVDSWSGQTSEALIDHLQRRGIDFLIIPKLTTKFIQPLDVGFNLQHKKFLKRIYEAALDPSSGVSISSLDSRDGLINAHSLIWNQFGSESYTDMIRHSWHNTDPHYSLDELSRRPPPRGVIDIQFTFDQTRCQHHDHETNTTCSRPAFLKCSHCGKILCLKHFLDRVCFHESNEDRARPSGTQAISIVQTSGDDTEHDDFDPDLFRNRPIRPSSTSAQPPGSTTTTTTTTTTPAVVIDPSWIGRNIQSRRRRIYA